MARREHHIKVSLTEAELLRLDELRGDEDRAVFLRRLLQGPPDGSEVATHKEALGILTRLARDGKAAAAIALEKAVREQGSPSSELEDFLRGG
jgi:hypothetical protein